MPIAAGRAGPSARRPFTPDTELYDMPGLGFTLITVPRATYSAAKLKEAISKHTFDVREITVPQLRVGTLNVLTLSDTLSKLDMSCMSVVGQVEKLGRDIHLQTV